MNDDKDKLLYSEQAKNLQVQLSLIKRTRAENGRLFFAIECLLISVKENVTRKSPIATAIVTTN